MDANVWIILSVILFFLFIIIVIIVILLKSGGNQTPDQKVLPPQHVQRKAPAGLPPQNKRVNAKPLAPKTLRKTAGEVLPGTTGEELLRKTAGEILPGTAGEEPTPLAIAKVEVKEEEVKQKSKKKNSFKPLSPVVAAQKETIEEPISKHETEIIEDDDLFPVGGDRFSEESPRSKKKSKKVDNSFNYENKKFIPSTRREKMNFKLAPRSRNIVEKLKNYKNEE